MTQRTRLEFKCVECGAIGPAGSVNKRYCGKVCRAEFERKRDGIPCASCGGKMKRGITLRPGISTCHPCRRKGHGRGAYSRGCRCAECREANNEEARLYRVKRRESGNPIRRVAPRSPLPVISRECIHCGETFGTKDSRTRACSSRCGLYAYHGFSPSRELGPVSWPARSTVAPVTVVRRTEWWAGFVYGPCTWCGGLFMAASTKFQDKYCSKRCAARASKAAYRMSRGEFRISDRERLAIYERDGWTCQLCFESIDRDAHYLDSWAPSLDHIEPQSATLIPDHSAKNLRQVHMWCNAVRGDGTINIGFFDEAVAEVVA